MAIILFVAMYYRSMKSTTALQIKAAIFSPAYLQLTVLSLCLLVSILSLIHETYLIIKGIHSEKIHSINEITQSNEVIIKNGEQNESNVNGFIYADV